MKYALLDDIVQPDSQPTGTAAQTRTFRLKREARRLDFLTLKLRVTTAAVAITGAAWGGLAGIVKEIRVKLQDGASTRNAVQVSGIGLLSWLQFSTVENLDRKTLIGYASSGFPTSTTVDVCFRIPFADPRLQEPFRNVLGVPLWTLADDVLVEVDLNDISAGGTVFTTNPPSYAATEALLLQVGLREGTEMVPYIPTELRTTGPDVLTTVSNGYYEFGSYGFLTGFGIQTFSAAAIGNATTRASMLAAGGLFRLEYGRKIQRRTNEGFQIAAQDNLRSVYPDDAAASSAVLAARNFAGEYFWDLIKDSPGSAAFSIASVLELNPAALSGDKCRLFFNDAASTTRGFSVTQHRLLPKQLSDLNALVAGA
jgi:hypothetical protein